MSVLKSSATNLLNSEKKALFNFLSLFSVFILLIIILSSTLYYNAQHSSMLQNRYTLMQNYAYELTDKLKILHRTFEKNRYYPRDYRYESAIYDIDQEIIFTTQKESYIKPKFDRTIYEEEKRLYFIQKLDSYYLGAKYIVIELEDDQIWLAQTKKSIIIYSILLFLFALIIGYILAKLFLKPMRESIVLLDHFIKDTTHELNTPINTLLANIEMIESQNIDTKFSKKIERMKIASKTISNLYEDLTYATLNHKIISKDIDLDISKISIERVEFFKTIARSKKVEFHLSIKNDIFLRCDKRKFSKLIDNLISNAIKYNKLHGSIYITVNDKSFVIEDTGIGIKEKEQKSIFSRYVRHDTTTGGFGIGLNIVESIVQEYGYIIKVTSKVGEGTKVTLSWEK